MKTAQEVAHADTPGWIERMVSLGGGAAGLLTAIAVGLAAIWHHGYRAGRAAERAQRQAAVIERLDAAHPED